MTIPSMRCHRKLYFCGVSRSSYCFTSNAVKVKFKNEGVQNRPLAGLKSCVVRSPSISVIIIVKKTQQCKAEREILTQYQSKDRSPMWHTSHVVVQLGLPLSLYCVASSAVKTNAFQNHINIFFFFVYSVI